MSPSDREEENRVTAGYRFEQWSGHAGLKESLPFWRTALEGCELDPLCNDPDWVLAYADAYCPDESLFGWRVSDASGEPIGFLAFRKEPARGRFALRRAQLLADGTFDSDYIDLIIRPGHEAGVWAGALDALATTKGVDAMHVNAVLADSPTVKALRELLEKRGLPSRSAIVECADAPLTESFDDYLKTLKKRMRSKVRQAVRIAGEKGATLAWCHDEASLDEHLEGLFRLHAMRWEESGESGAFAEEGRRKLYKAFAHNACKTGTLRFSRLDLDGQTVAYQFGARAGDRYYQMQEGYHTDFADARVATALRALSIQHLIDEGVRQYDFMAGMSRHKRDWGGAARDCISIAFALPNVRARLSYGARAFVDRWREKRATSA